MGKTNFEAGPSDSTLMEHRMSVKEFFDSAQNRTGMSIWVGTAITALIQRFIFHEFLSSADLLGIVLGFLKIVEPDNTVTVSQLKKSMADMGVLIAAPKPDSRASVIFGESGLAKVVNG